MSLFRLSNHIFELGLTSPSLEIAQKLCKALGVSMDDIFGE